MTSLWRCGPDFLIIGVQKAGTSSLYAYLADHPQVIMPKVKEVHFFDWAYNKGTGFYRSFFPYKWKMILRQMLAGRCITGEASPYYILHREVPQRVFNFDREIKLILILRDPIERFISQYAHNIRHGYEERSIADVLEAEMLESHEDLYSRRNRHYLARGLYSVQLARWRKLFPAEQILVLNFDDLHQNQGRFLEEVSRFLGISFNTSCQMPLKNKNEDVLVEFSDFDRLTSYYSDDVLRLESEFGLNFEWMQKYLIHTV